MLRNRIHRLLGAQREVKLPQCSDLFGRKGLSFLEKLELPAPARLLLTQQLALLKELAVRIHEDEKALEGLLQETPALNYVRSLPGMGPILAAVVVSEIHGIERFPSAQKLVATPVCVLPPTAAGARQQETATRVDRLRVVLQVYALALLLAMLGVTPPFVKNCTLRRNAGWKRLAPKWPQLAISEASVATPMIVSGQVDVFPPQRRKVRCFVALREHACFVKTSLDSLLREDMLLPAWPEKSAGSVVRNTPRFLRLSSRSSATAWSSSSLAEVDRNSNASSSCGA